VAEDNLVNQEIILELLESDGHTVRSVVDGEEVLLALGEEYFDLVMMIFRCRDLMRFRPPNAYAHYRLKLFKFRS